MLRGGSRALWRQGAAVAMPARHFLTSRWAGAVRRPEGKPGAVHFEQRQQPGPGLALPPLRCCVQPVSIADMCWSPGAPPEEGGKKNLSVRKFYLLLYHQLGGLSFLQKKSLLTLVKNKAQV